MSRNPALADRGPNALRSIETAPVHHSARRRRGRSPHLRSKPRSLPRSGFGFPGPQAAMLVRVEAMLNGLDAVGYSASAQVHWILRASDVDPTPDCSAGGGNRQVK